MRAKNSCLSRPTTTRLSPELCSSSGLLARSATARYGMRRPHFGSVHGLTPRRFASQALGCSPLPGGISLLSPLIVNLGQPDMREGDAGLKRSGLLQCSDPFFGLSRPRQGLAKNQIAPVILRVVLQYRLALLDGLR